MRTAAKTVVTAALAVLLTFGASTVSAADSAVVTSGATGCCRLMV